jgi:uncharacterized membrane protein YhdT
MTQRFGVDPERGAQAARRAVLVALLLWVPMAVMAFVEGTALPGKVDLPFLYDVAAYVRPLVVVPILLVAEVILALTWRRTGELLSRRGIVDEACRPAYEALLARVTRAVRRLVPELLCAALAVWLCFRLVDAALVAHHDAWFMTAGEGGAPRLSAAGAWHAFAVHGAFFYLSLRWLWLFSLWYRFLFGVARLPLRLYPAHPDRAAGLGFVGRSIAATSPIVLAWSASLASAVANRMLHAGERLLEFAPMGAAFLVLVLVVFLLPPALIFVPLLVRTRRVALEDWSHRLAHRAEGEEDVLAAAPTAGGDEPVTNLEELDIAVSAVRAMRPVPIDWPHLVAPVLAAAAPAVPLLFLAFPAREIFQGLFRLMM